MAFPIFRKLGLDDLQFSKGYLYPTHERLQFHQLKEQAEGGPLRVYTIRAPDTTFPLHFENMPLADYQALRAWLLSTTINGSANTFTFIDIDSVEYLVRWWPQDGVLDLPQVRSGLYTFDLQLFVDAFGV